MASKEIKRELKEKTTGYILGAFGLVVGLAWNEAISRLIDDVFKFNKNGILAKFIYAIILTILLIFATRYLVRENN